VIVIVIVNSPSSSFLPPRRFFEAGAHEDVQDFAAKSGRRVDRREFLPPLCPVACLLLEFPPSAMERLFAGIQLSRRKLPDELIERIPVLAYEDDPLIGENRQRHSPAAMFGHFPDRCVAGWILHLVDDRREDAALIDLFPLKKL